MEIDPTIQLFKNIKLAISITTYDFLTLYTKLPHDKLKSKLSSVVGFPFKMGKKLLLEHLIIVQHTGGRKQKGDLVLVKHNLK